MKKFVLPLIILAFLATSLQGQVMNIEQERMQTDTTGWAGSAALSFQYLKNKTEFWSAGANIHLQYKTKKSLYLWLTNYSLAKSAGESFANSGIQHLRYNYKILDWLTAEAFTQAQFNEVLSVKFRWLLGGGPRFKAVQTKPFRLYLGTLYMYEYEEISDTAIYHRDHRLSAYVSFTLKIKDNLSLINTTYYQPKFNDFADYRISSQTDLKIKISKHFAFITSYIYYYDAVPAENIPSETHNLQNSLTFDF